MYIYFQPSGALKYRIEWKLVTEATYPTANVINVDKVPGLWNSVIATVPNTNSDYNFKVTSICNNDNFGDPRFGIVRSTCVGVTFTAVYNHCTCLVVTGITMTAT